MGRQVPAWVRKLFDAAGVRACLLASDEPLFVAGEPGRGLTGRTVVAVRVGRELLEGTADAATVVRRLGLPPGLARVVAVRAHVGDERHAAVLLAFEQATTGFGWSRPGRSASSGTSPRAHWRSRCSPDGRGERWNAGPGRAPAATGATSP